MKLILALILLFIPIAVNATTRYVSPYATGSGDGTIGNPWSIWTALVLPGDAGNPVQPGDVVYLRGGAYNLDTTPNEEGAGSDVVYFELSGTAANPIIVRNYPGERAIIQVDYILNMGDGYPGRGYVHWIGNNSGGGALEFMDPKTRKWSYGSWGFPRIATISVIGSGVKIINCVIHDLTTVFFSEQGFNNELYGNLIYYMGNNSTDIPMPGQPFGNAGYIQNVTGTKGYVNNIAWGGLRNNVQVFSTNGHTKHITVAGNTIFSPGALYPGNVGINAIVGRGTDENDPTSVAEDITFNDNSLYVPVATKTNAEIVGTFFVNTDLEFRRNYILGGSYAANFGSWNPAEVTDNVIVGDATLMSINGTPPASGTWNNNQYYKGDANKFRYNGSRDFAGWKAATGLDTNSTYSAARPAGTSVVIRANIYEQGRANITVFNWNLASTANVNLSTTGLVNGQQYEIRDAQNFFGSPVSTGTYSSSSPTVTLTLPGASSPVTPVQGASDPINDGWIILPVHTSVEFNAFVVLPGAVGSVLPPTVTLTAPANASTVSGMVNVTSTAAATSPATISNVKYYLDNVLLGTGGAAPAYSYPWNTTLSNNGTHFLKAVTTDTNGLTSDSTITVTLNNTGPDTVPPTVALSNLVTGDFLRGNVVIEATGSDNVAVTSVQFRRRIGAGSYTSIGAADTTAPYAVVENASALAPGSYEYTAVAGDAAGNSTVSAVANVTVVNPSGYSEIINDQMTGPPGTNLNSHVSDSGHTWSRHANAIYATGNFLLNNDAAHSDNNTNRAMSVSSGIPQTDSYVVSLKSKTVANDGSQMQVVGQADPTADKAIVYGLDGSLQEVAIWHRNEGTNTKLGSYSTNLTGAGETHYLSLEFVNGAIHGYFDGIRRIVVPVNPIAISSTRRVGLRGPGTAQTAASGHHADAFTVSAITGNFAPTVSAGSDQSLPFTTSVSLSWVATDPENDTLTKAWTLVSGPNTPSIPAVTTSPTLITALVPGVYIFRLSVDDGVNPPATDDVQIIIAAASGPVVNKWGG